MLYKGRLTDENPVGSRKPCPLFLIPAKFQPDHTSSNVAIFEKERDWQSTRTQYTLSLKSGHTQKRFQTMKWKNLGRLPSNITSNQTSSVRANTLANNASLLQSYSEWLIPWALSQVLIWRGVICVQLLCLFLVATAKRSARYASHRNSEYLRTYINWRFKSLRHAYTMHDKHPD